MTKTRIIGILLTIGILVLFVWIDLNLRNINTSGLGLFTFLWVVWIAGFMTNTSEKKNTFSDTPTFIGKWKKQVDE